MAREGLVGSNPTPGANNLLGCGSCGNRGLRAGCNVGTVLVQADVVVASRTLQDFHLGPDVPAFPISSSHVNTSIFLVRDAEVLSA